MRRVYLTIAVLTLLLASCGKQYKAEGIVEDFITANAKSPEKFKKKDFVHFDSTKVLTDSALVSLRSLPAPLYKTVKYESEAKARRLLYTLRMRYVYDSDSLTSTFYLDEDLTHVVAFK